MREYHKIQTVFKRDVKGRIIEGDFSVPAFEYLYDNEWLWTEKVDGTNIRIGWDGEKVTFGGRTDNAQIPALLVMRLQELFLSLDAQTMFEQKWPFACDVVLYGEGYGAKIQKGGGNYKADGVDFVLFDVLVDGWWLLRDDIEEVAESFGIKAVPVFGEGCLSGAVEHVKKGIQSHWGEFPAEGLVCRPIVELKTRKGDRVITKIKHRDFGG